MLVHRYPKLLEGRLVARYARFLVDVRLTSGRVVRAHCVNSGRMEGLVREGARVWLSEATTPGRRLKFTWELSEERDAAGRPILVGVNTALPNRLVETVLATRAIAGFDDVTRIERERAYGRGHRVDLLLTHANGTQHYVEVKNCHLVYPDGGGYFPDSRSERAERHVGALARLLGRGHRATVIFTVQRRDGRFVRPSVLHDRAFARAFRAAVRAGVEARALAFDVTRRGLTLLGELPVDAERYDERSLTPWKEALATTSGWRARVPR